MRDCRCCNGVQYSRHCIDCYKISNTRDQRKHWTKISFLLLHYWMETTEQKKNRHERYVATRSESAFAALEKRKRVSDSSLTPRNEDGGYYYYQSEWSVVVLGWLPWWLAVLLGYKRVCRPFSTLDTAQVRERGRPQHSDFLLNWACLVVPSEQLQ